MEGDFARQGRKTFFLSPHDVVRSRIVPDMMAREFEIYALDDFTAVDPLFREFGEVLVYINLDRPDTWTEAGLHRLAEACGPVACIGGITAGNGSGTSTGLSDLLAMGIVDISQGAEKAAVDIAMSLRSHGAMGQRKFLRFGSAGEQIARLSAVINGRRISGIVHDISSVGLSCSFDDDRQIEVGDTFYRLMIDVEGDLPALNGRINLKRDMLPGAPAVDGSDSAVSRELYVLMFDRRRKDVYADAIHNFIYRSLQSAVDRKIMSIKQGGS